MKKLNPKYIIHKGLELLVVNKPAGMAVQSLTPEESLLHIVQEEHGPTYQLVNRIDQVVSGIVLLSDNDHILYRLNDLFKKRAVKKTYYAIVEKKKDIIKNGTMEGFLFHSRKIHKAYISENEKPETKHVSLEYTLVKELDNYYLLKILPQEGRFHQIRALLSHYGYPIKGDVKYGARRKNRDRSIYLHAYKIEFPKVIDGHTQYIAPIPNDNLWDAHPINQEG